MATMVQPELIPSAYAANHGAGAVAEPQPRALHLHTLQVHTDLVESGAISRRARMVLDWLRQNGPSTDRQVRDGLFGQVADMNMVRPRISDLIEQGLVYEVGATRDQVTDRPVRIVRALNPGELK
jgi:hypothetical protein